MIFNIIIDKKLVSVNANMTILQACESVHIIVPKFCYHERLSIAGNCRMCLVEIDKAPKLVASCAMPVIQNMIVRTNSLAVKKAREGVLEFLLINHPLDCVICDQAGECDLQEQSKGFGSDRGRFQENKRAVQDFECGPLIKTIMTRCIHCTRCVRFANEIIGLPDLGTSGRGGSLEINLYIKKLFKSEFSGNLIDLCPVGALTSKPYTFMARSWELKSIESIDILDGIGSNIRLDTRGYELMRILPRLNENINEEWISDKTRFAFDGLRQQRLYEPLFKNVNNNFEVITWKQALNLVVQKLEKINFSYKFGAVIGPQADLNSISLLNHLVKKVNGKFFDFDNVNLLSLDFKSSYLFNSNIKNLENSDVCILLGVNPRIEGAILNLRLRKRYLSGNFKVASFGSFFDVSFPIYNLGSTLSSFLKFIEGRHSFSKYFAKSQKPIIIVGQSFLENIGEKESLLILKLLTKNTSLFHKKWCGINILNNNASDVGKYEIGIKTFSPLNSELDMLYIIGEGKFKNLNPSTFVIYQGYQANNTTQKANLILPGKSFTEKISAFVNIEGRYQLTKTATSSPTSSKEDWAVLYAILEKTNLVSFIKTYASPSYLQPNLIATNTFLKKIEMDPFFGLKAKKPNIVELGINDPNLVLNITKIFKELNYSFSLQKDLNKSQMQLFSDISISYPEIFQLYLSFVQVVHVMFQSNLNFSSYGLIFLELFQKFLLCYKLLPNLNFLELLQDLLGYLEIIIAKLQSQSSFSNKLSFDTIKEHLNCLSSSKFYPILSDNVLEVKSENLYINFKFAFEYLNEKEFIFNEKKKFVKVFPEIVRLFYLSNYGHNKKMPKYFFYSVFSFYKKHFFKDGFVNRYKNNFIIEKTNERADLFYEIYNQKQFEFFYLGIKTVLKYYKKDIDYSFTYNNDIWIKFSTSISIFNTVEIKFSQIPIEEYNKISYQSLNLKNVYFSNSLNKIILLQNKVLPSSKLDNFYLMNDFSKLSLLMKNCSDTFLERSPFKK